MGIDGIDRARGGGVVERNPEDVVADTGVLAAGEQRVAHRELRTCEQRVVALGEIVAEASEPDLARERRFESSLVID
jgi:hypothetical protein